MMEKSTLRKVAVPCTIVPGAAVTGNSNSIVSDSDTSLPNSSVVVNDVPTVNVVVADAWTANPSPVPTVAETESSALTWSEVLTERCGCFSRKRECSRLWNVCITIVQFKTGSDRIVK